VWEPRVAAREQIIERATDAIIKSENTAIEMLRFRARGYATAAVRAFVESFKKNKECQADKLPHP
jgi:hypothetical protein